MATTEQTAAAFRAAILAQRSETQREAYRRYFPDTLGEPGSGGSYFAGVRMGTVFQLAKAHLDLPPAELEAMLDDDVHEVRVGALKAMALDAARRRTTPERREELFQLYLRRHDRIDDWDLVDLAAAPVVGAHLLDRDRGILRELAASEDRWRRRTAIVATAAFIRRGEVDDALQIAELLIADPELLVQKAVAWMLRYAGDVDVDRLRGVLERRAAAMPRVMLRGAIEKLDRDERATWLAR